MALYIFTKAILEGRPLPVFNHGDMKRDFTYIDDIVAGILAACDKPPQGGNGAPHRVYNIGNHRSEPLMRVIELLERALGKKAEIRFEPMQPGDVKESFADIDDIARDLGYAPTTSIDEGIPKFVAWYREYHRV
jgi:UDP-glucuronate 4-epimerase